MKPQTPLQRAYDALGITDAEMARRTGWTSQQICRVRHGKAKASHQLALALVRELAPHIEPHEIPTAERRSVAA